MNDETSTLSRWSRLKREAEAEKQSYKSAVQEASEATTAAPELGVQLDTDSAPVDLPEPVPYAQTSIVEPVDQELLLSDEDMPELATLTSQSDVSMFFNKGVSNALRSAALKTLFQLPKYNIRDGLNDYDEDYTYFEPLGDTVTCDMKFHKERKEREAREAEERDALLAEQEEAARTEEEAKSEQSEDETAEAELTEDTAHSDDVDQEPKQEPEIDDTQDGPPLESDDALNAEAQPVADTPKSTDNTVDV